jgi:hypothetical protein
MKQYKSIIVLGALAIATTGCVAGGAAVDGEGNTIQTEMALTETAPAPIQEFNVDSVVESTPEEWTANPFKSVDPGSQVSPADVELPAQTDTDSLMVTPLTPTIHADNPRVMIKVQALDNHQKGLGSDLPVQAVFNGKAIEYVSDKYARCTTDANGECVIGWTVPETAFAAGGTITADINLNNMKSRIEISVFAKPTELKINKPGAGWQLPTTPRAEGSTFDVPLYIETNATPGAYDVALNFDGSKLAVTSVTYGKCAAFGMPTHNLEQGANEVGTLKVIGMNSWQAAPCAQDNRVHVATVRFRVLDGVAEENTLTTTELGCTVNTLIDVNFAQVADSKPCDFGDAMGTDTTGEVLLTTAL